MSRGPFAGIAAALLLGVSAPGVTSGPGTQGAPADRWNLIQLVVARESVGSGLHPFYRSLMLWAGGTPGGATAVPGGLTLVDGDMTAETDVNIREVVHVRGNVESTLHVEGHAEVIVGGSVLPGGRIEAEGITAVHVEGDVRGVVSCARMASVWIRGNLSGTVLTGAPSLQLSVGGDLLGAVRPSGAAALLYVDVRGRMPSSAIEAAAAHRYTELRISAGTSDVEPGLRLLGPNALVAVTGLEK